MAKYEPTKELKEQIIQWYNETKNYTEIARRTGLSTFIIKRIVSENSSEILVDKVIVKYNGIIPKEHLIEWLNSENAHSIYYQKLKELSNELRANNGEFQD